MYDQWIEYRNLKDLAFDMNEPPLVGARQMDREALPIHLHDSRPVAEFRKRNAESRAGVQQASRLRRSRECHVQVAAADADDMHHFSCATHPSRRAAMVSYRP